MKKGKRYFAGVLAMALLLGIADFPARAQAASGNSASANGANGASGNSVSVNGASGNTVSGNAGARRSEGLEPETAEWIESAGAELAAMALEREIMALVYLSDTYPVREQPDYESQAVVNVPSGQLVNIEDLFVTMDEEENPEVWYFVRLLSGETEYTGYVPRYYLAVSDERFLSWEESYGLNFQAATYTIDSAGCAVYPDIEQFPESYRPALTALKQKHPNWTFAVMNTGLDWNTVIANELTGGKSLVYKTFPDYAI